MMNDDQFPLEMKREKLKSLMVRVPPRVISAGVIVTRQYIADLETASRAVSSSSMSRIEESIQAMQLWHQGEIPGYHPAIE